MDDNTRRLVIELCDHAGMMMEDASVLARMVGVAEPSNRSEMVRRLMTQSDQIQFLLAGAVTLQL